MTIKPQHIPVLKQLKNCKTLTRRKKLLLAGGKEIQRVLREIAYNILRGAVKLSKSQKKRLRKHQGAVRTIALKKTPLRKRLSLEQRGGFLTALLAPLLAGVTSAVLR